MAREVRCKRVYEPAAPEEDGLRILVDRLWPRGVSKEDAAVDDWIPELGPSHELRRWFGHEPERWKEFVRRYEEELDDRAGALEDLWERAGDGPLTLVYSARDEEHNQAVALAGYLRRRFA